MAYADTVTPELQRIKAELEMLKKMRIHVGVQGSSGKGADGEGVAGSEADLLTIAGVHEYGATITAKNAKNLAIPIHPEAKNKSPRDFDGIFFIEAKDTGNVFACVLKGGRKNKDNPNNLKLLFLLLPSVTIPERSFIRAGYDNTKNRLDPAVQHAISGIIHEQWPAQQAADYIGGIAVGLIKEFMNDASNFKPKGTIAAKMSNWPDNPLIESGRLRNSISFTVEEVS